MHGVPEQLLGRLPEEGDAADEELVEDDAHAPPVHRLAVALAEDHLGRDVLGGAEHLLVRELSCLLVDVSLVQVGGQGHEPHLAQPEVGELDVAQRRDQEVVRLQVPVHDPEGVKILHGQNSLREVESGNGNF